MKVLTCWKSARAGGLGLLGALALSASAQPLYNLVLGLEKFDGSTTAWHLLETNGFVVTDPEYKAIFEPYLDSSLPAFITTDSAWHTYHCLAEEGATELLSRHLPLPASMTPPAWLTNGIDSNNPSGLDLFVAWPDARSDAATRAFLQMEPHPSLDTLEKTPFPSSPDSLAADAMRLLATLQRPLPRGLAPAYRTGAWMDLQLWTQLGMWAEQCHTGSPPPPSGEPSGESDLPSGAVAPYPDFFSGLAALSRQAAKVMAQAGLDSPFDAKIAARKLLDTLLWEETSAGGPAIFEVSPNLAGGGLSGQETKPKQDQITQFNQFLEEYQEARRAEMADNPQELMNDLDALAHRCLTNSSPSFADLNVLRAFFDHRQTVPHLLEQFAPVCDQLALLARKSLNGAPLTAAEQAWVGQYGATLSHFAFFGQDPALGLRDDSSQVDPLCVNPGEHSVFHAALGRPQALYIILPSEGRLQLFRGAVLDYREFVRPSSQVLTDDSWRSLARTGRAPPAPAFTRSFFMQKDAGDLLATFDTPPSDAPGIDQQAQTMAELQARVTDADLPALIAALGKNRAESPFRVADGIATAIAELNWAPCQRDLIALLDKDDGRHSGPVFSILNRHPAWLDTAFLCANFNHVSPPARRVYCALLGLEPTNDLSRATLLAALRDSAPAVRWQAAFALAEPSSGAEKNMPALLRVLTDENPLVAAAAAFALGHSGAANSAPALLARLQQILAQPDLSDEASERAAAAIHDFSLPLPGQTNGLNFLSGRMRRFVLQRTRASFAPFTPANALIEALGSLGYHPSEDCLFPLLEGTHAAAAAKALEKLNPEKLIRRLAAIACDKNAPPQSRDDAIFLLASHPSSALVLQLAPLLDDTTIVASRRVVPGREWRICDAGASVIATLLGRPLRIVPMQSADQRDQEIEEVRQWLKSTY